MSGGRYERRWTWRTVGPQAVHLLRSEGPGSLLVRVLADTVCRRLTVIELPLASRPARPEVDLPLEFGFLDAADVETYAEIHGGAGVAEAQARFARGERCFVARHDGRLVHTRWIAAGHAYVEYLDRTLALREGDVYLYETYTPPGIRGRSISPAVGAALAEALAAEGAARIVALVLRQNAAAWRSPQKVGFRPCGSIGWIGVGPLRRHFGRI